MFEKLGYKEINIVEEYGDGYDESEFIEYKKGKLDWISINKIEGSYCHEDRQGITLEEHKAITQLLKELGFLE